MGVRILMCILTFVDKQKPLREVLFWHRSSPPREVSAVPSAKGTRPQLVWRDWCAEPASQVPSLGPDLSENAGVLH